MKTIEIIDHEADNEQCNSVSINISIKLINDNDSAVGFKLSSRRTPDNGTKYDV